MGGGSEGAVSKEVSKLVFYAQSTGTVISGRGRGGCQLILNNGN